MNDNLPVKSGNSSIYEKEGGGGRGPCLCFNQFVHYITIHYLLRFCEKQYVYIVYPFQPNGISHYWSISVLRVVRYFTLLFKFLFNIL